MSDLRTTKIAVFGGGCFWCTEAVFKMLKGIVSVMPGYAGGTTANPTYENVCTGRTGHAEVIKIEYDPEKISFRTLLTIFFATHDPTMPNRQGADVGTEYRSIILYTDEDQHKEALAFIDELNASSKEGQTIVTEIKPLTAFYPAEKYNQDFYNKNPQSPYCQIVINPKLQKVQEQFAELLNTGSEK